MAKPDRKTTVRNRLARAMTVPEQDFIPPSFGIAFTKKDTPRSSATTSQKRSPSPPQPKPQAYGPAVLVGSEIPAVVSRFNLEVQSSPLPQRSQSMMKQARPGSVFIPRRSPVDYALGEKNLIKSTPVTTVTTTVASAGTQCSKTTTATTRVRFASPTTQSVEVNTPPAETQPVQTQPTYHQTTTPVSSQNGISIQNRTSIPLGASAESQINPALTTSTLLQQPRQLPFQPQIQPQPTNSPNQPAFAVIAQDPSALQALLSGDLGGRTFIIQPLQQPYILPQFHVTPPQYPPFAITQPVVQPPVYSNQQDQLIVATKTQSPMAPIQEPLQNQSLQNPTAETPKELPLEIAPPTITLREATPQPIIEPLTIATDTRPLPQTAPCSRSPPRSVQSIFKHHSPQLQQTHEAHKIPLREPQRLSTPVFLQKAQKTQTPSPQTEQQVVFAPAKTNTPKPASSNPLCEYAEKLKLAPNRAVNRRTLVGGTKKSKSMPESENLRAISMTAGDSSVMSVIDRARLWQEERKLEELVKNKSGFVDHDLIAHGDELVPVEERVRAFNTGQVLEENEAAKKRFDEEFEEERNRRIREQSFPADAKPQTIIRLANRQQCPRTQTPGPMPSQDSLGDTLSKLSVKEKSSLFTRRSGGGRPIKMDRTTIQRRKTQPITLDDIARVNQCILQGSGIPPDSPMESFKEEDLEIGSCLSSPAASVLSDFSEIVCAQNPSKYRGLRIC
nr:supervillin [Hymenolepis microstoma]